MKMIFASLLAVFFSCSTPVQQDATATRISAETYKEHHAKQEKAILVDVRTPAEFERGHLQGAKISDFLSKEFHNEMAQWDKSKTYYLYCATGNRSGQAARLMEEAGFKKVYNIGGYEELKEAGLPVVEPQP